MKRLYEDLLIPSDNGLDDQYYGSKFSAGPNQPYRTRHKDDFKNILKEIQPLEHFPMSSAINQNDRPLQKNHRYETLKHPVFSKPNNLELEGREIGCLEDKTQNSLKSDDKTILETFKPQSQVTIPLPNQKTVDVTNIPEVEGYFSDFTNDTDNDIEEEFDFD